MRTKFDPWLGPRIGKAWIAGLSLLANGDWTPVPDLRSTMVAAGPVMSQTVSTILREAKKAGVIEMKGGYSQVKRRDYRKARLIVAEPHYWLDVPVRFVTEIVSDSGGRAGGEDDDGASPSL